MLEVEQVQKEVWGIADREIYPALALVPVIELGGVLIGAFDGERIAGFVFGFPGQEHGKRILHSDMLAVRPEYRRHGLGYRLKMAQRERALAQGVDTITWTFDPLQARNARLNFGKLGVIADSYRVNYYGETTSFLHQAGTDRLWVTWLLNDERVRGLIDKTLPGEFWSAAIVPVLRVDEQGEPKDILFEPDSEKIIAIEIPEDINRLATDLALTTRWRTASRNAFTRLIEAGFRAIEFHFFDGPHGRVGRYLLTHHSSSA
jgi:predicted GNAT superfamily acetyltransferase